MRRRSDDSLCRDAIEKTALWLLAIVLIFVPTYLINLAISQYRQADMQQVPAIEPISAVKCKACGREWFMWPPHSGDPESGDLDWCVYDGAHCEEGLALAIEERTSKSSDARAKLIEHCDTCLGCRFASFSPKGWESATKNQVAIPPVTQ